MINDELPLHEGRQLPVLYGLREIDLPEIVPMEVGDQKYLILKVEMVAKRSGAGMGLADSNDQRKMEGDFQIHSIKVLGQEPVDAKTLESKEFQAVIAKVKSGEM